MAEIKNNFIQAKMNKDLDARLLPNGQYRDAQNIVISRTEGESVGAVQNVLGNIQLSNFGLTERHLEIIGYFVDDVKDRVYLFITNYTDSSSDNLSNFAPSTSSHYIVYFNPSTNESGIMVQGSFLNFSTLSPVNGVDMIEEFLFFTDNRNQPRKINIESAILDSSYYISEDTISIIKYYPHEPISLIKSTVTAVTTSGQDAGQNWNSVTLPYEVPPSLISVTNGTVGTGFAITITGISGNPDNYITSWIITNGGSGYDATSYIEVKNPNGNRDDSATFFVSTVDNVSTMLNKTDAYLPPNLNNGKNTNPDYDADWAGDKDFLKEKFIKFSYRFKFEDDEYSLIAPFTQTCFVPRNNGYFLSLTYNASTGNIIPNDSDENYAYTSTINRLMENQVNNIELLIPCPASSNDWASAVNDLKISEIEIIFKDASEVSLKVVDTISASELSKLGNNIKKVTYDYQSRKPIRTLPESVITRTSDKAPIRAETLSCVGNRVVFGNYYDKHSSPSVLDYNVQVVDKNQAESVEYVNHTLKQNRTYQVGVILSDRYGRQSDVILSEVNNGVVPGLADVFSGSTVFNSYRNLGDTPLNTSSSSWNGENLQTIWTRAIPDTINSPGYPGLYSPTNPLGFYSYRLVIKQQEQDYYNVYLPSILRAYPNDPLKEPNETAHISLFSDNINKVPKDLTDVGPEAKEFRSGVRLYGRVTNNRSMSSGNVQFYPSITGDFVNTIGTQRDLNIGESDTIAFEPVTPGTTGTVSSIHLDGEARDKIMIGQRISLQDDTGNSLFENRQVTGYSVGPSGFNKSTVTFSPSYTIPNNVSLGTTTFQLSPFYNAENNPLIARISTTRSPSTPGIGSTIGDVVDFTGAASNYFPINLAVYETKPVVSNLDIFYETTTSGLISELNTAITAGDATTAYSYSSAEFNWFENMIAGTQISTTVFPLNASNVPIIDTTAVYTLTSVEEYLGENNFTVLPNNGAFEVNTDGNGGFFVKLKSSQAGETFSYGQNDLSNYRFWRFNVTGGSQIFGSFAGSFDAVLSNIIPSATFTQAPGNPPGVFIHGSGTLRGPQDSPNQGFLYIGSLLETGHLSNPEMYSPNVNGQQTSITNGSISPDSAIKTSQLKIVNLRAELMGQTGGTLSWINTGDFIGYQGIQGSEQYIRPCRARVSTNNQSQALNGIVDSRDNSTTGLGIEFIDNIQPQYNQGTPPANGTEWDIYFDLVDCNGGGLSQSFGPLRFIYRVPV